jgi:hypothetical protein
LLGELSWVVFGAVFFGCSDDDAEPSADGAVAREDAAAAQDTGVDGGDGDDAAAQDAGDAGQDAGEDRDAATEGETVSLTGQIVEALPDGTFPPYAGGEVCVLDSDPQRCATSDSGGMVTIDLPANAQTGLTTEMDGFIPMLTLITTGDSDIEMAGRGAWFNSAASVLVDLEQLDTFAEMLGTTMDPEKGHVDMLAFTLNGGAVTPEDAEAEIVWYTAGGVTMPADPGVPSGSTLYGLLNVDPGTVTFRAEKDAAACDWDPLLWTRDDAGGVTVPIRAGWWTRLLQVTCE